MGLFEDLGKKAERLKQEAVAASEGEATHVCSDCETLLYADRSECPECGSGAVEPLDSE